MTVASKDQAVKIGNNDEFKYEVYRATFAICLRTFRYSLILGHVVVVVVVVATGVVLGQQNTSSEQPPAQYGRH